MLELPGINALCQALSIKKLQTRMEQEQTLGDVLENAFTFSGFGRYRTMEPNQHSEELEELIRVLRARSPRTIVEIGTAEGGTLYTLARALPAAERVISVDRNNDNRARFLKAFAPNCIAIVTGDSHDPSTRESVRRSLGEESAIDFLFIDGDHSYEGVSRDFETYRGLMADDGVIGFHDITERPSDAWYHNGVHEFWTQTKRGFRHLEIIHDDPARFTVRHPDKQERINRYAGIGLLFLADDPDPQLSEAI